VKLKGKRIIGVKCTQLGTEKEFVIEGNLFIDATGDGVVAYSAGAKFRYGREGKNEFNESLAPKKPDKGIMGNSLLFAVKDLGHPVSFTPPEWAEKYPKNSITMKLRYHSYSPGYWWIEVGYPFDTIADNEKIRDELLRHVLGVWDHLKNQGNHNMENFTLDWIGMVPGKRESRRFIGDYILKERDLKTGRIFPDAVSYGGWFIDLHTPGGILAKDKPPEPLCGDPKEMDSRLVPVYSIPYSCLYSKNTENLLLAGRDISVTHVALGSTRLMATCAVIGQATGTASFLCKKYHLRPKEIYPNYIKEIQQQLLKDDCYIPGVKNEDPFDLAKETEVTASSQSVLSFPEAKIGKRLNQFLGQLFPVSRERLEKIRLFLEAKKRTEVVLHLRKAKNIWDFTGKKDLFISKVILPTNYKGWVDFNLPILLKPHSLYWFFLEKNKNVLAYGGNLSPTGTVSLYKPFEKFHWLTGGWNFSVKLEPEQYPYGPENVISGISRSESWTNIWISNPKKLLPQSIFLDFKKEVSSNSIYLTFDTNLNSRYLPPLKAPAESVRDYTLFYQKKGKWIKILKVKDNYQRHRQHRFKPITTSRLRLEVSATNGSPEARVYEIRVY